MVNTRLGLVLGLVLCGRVASAQPVSKLDEARAHFTTATQLYDENNLRGALVEFQRAYELSPSYKLLFNIGQVEMELQDYAAALKAYTRYLREGGPDVPADRQTLVTAEITRLKGRVGQLTVQTAAGAEVLVDDISVGFAPLPEPAPLNAGRHVVSVRIRGRAPESRVVDLAGQEQLTVVIANDAAVTSTVLPPPKPPTPESPPSKVPVIVAWSATGAAAIGWGVFGLIARGDAKDLGTLRATYPVTRQQLDDQLAKRNRSALIADSFTIATVVAVGVSTYLTIRFLRSGSSSGPEKKTVGLAVAPTGAFVVGSF